MTANRSTYQHRYYVRNKHRKTYTYVKKGVMKRLTKTQYEILAKMQQGFVLCQHFDVYSFWENKLYHKVNRLSVECLLRSKHIATGSDYIIRITEKGINHKQSIKKNT